MKFSIVVPVFNVEEYLADCLESLINQDIDTKEFEIIIVNDGSEDGSMHIAKNFIKKYDNVSIVNRENGGLSAARNTGLSMASGEYVWFVDSDDWIEPNCLNNLYQTAKSNNLDVLCFGVKYFHNCSHIDYSISPTIYDNQVFHGTDFVLKAHVIPAAWAAIYRREFLSDNNLFFYEGILHEDEEFTPRAYFLSNRVMFVQRHVYFYRQRQGSIMKSARNEQRCVDYLTIADSLYEFALDHTRQESKQRDYFIRKINRLVVQSLYYNGNGSLPITAYRNRDYFPLKITGLKYGVKEKIQYFMVNISPGLYVLVRNKLRVIPRL